MTLSIKRLGPTKGMTLYVLLLLSVFLSFSFQTVDDESDLKQLVQDGFPEWIEDDQLIDDILDSVYQLPTSEEFLPHFQAAYHYAILQQEYIVAYDFVDAIFEIYDSWEYPDKSLIWLNLAKKQIPQEYAREHASLENAYAMTYSLKNDLENEIKHYNRSIAYWEQVDSMTHYQCYPLGNLGMLYYDQGHYAASLQLARKTLALADSLGREDRLYSQAFDYILLADMMAKLHVKDSVSIYTRMAMQACEELDDPYTSSLINMWALTTYLDLDSLDAAGEFLMEYELKDLEGESRFELDDGYLMQMVRYYIKTNQIDAATPMVVGMTSPLAANTRVSHFEILRDYYLETGDMLQAKLAIDSLWLAFEQKQLLERRNDMALQTLETEKQELLQEQEYQDNRNTNQARLIFVLIAGLVFLGIGMWKAWQSAVRRKKALLKLSEVHSKLVEKNSELEKYIQSNIQLEQFAHIAAHDLKAPLRTITSFNGLLRKRLVDRLEDEEQNYLSFIEQGSKNMQDLIDDLLEYSKVNSQALYIGRFSLDRVVDELLEELKEQIIQKDAKVHLHGLHRDILGDRNKIKHVLENLISNALKFSREDQRLIITIAANESEDQVEICVRDNGVGIAEEFKDKIFQTFVKLHSIDEFAGTGIGLALCKKNIAKHGGKIWLDSIEGQGSSFYFSIPQREAFYDLHNVKEASFVL